MQTRPVLRSRRLVGTERGAADKPRPEVRRMHVEIADEHAGPPGGEAHKLTLHGEAVQVANLAVLDGPEEARVVVGRDAKFLSGVEL